MSPVDVDVAQKDHPRSRGEYGFPLPASLTLFGSSPLSRGILLVLRGWDEELRIIPALAGNTLVPVYLQWQVKDHPRSRGEYTL